MVTKRPKRPKPIQFEVRPVTRGLNYSRPPNIIDMRETPGTGNSRFTRGMLRHRSGFKYKYIGADDTLLWIDTAYPAGGGVGNLVAFGINNLWYDDGSNNLRKMMVYSSTGTLLLDPTFSPVLDPTLDVFIVDVGSGQYDFLQANGGATYPSGTEYADIGVLTSGTSDGIFVFAYTGMGGASVLHFDYDNEAGGPFTNGEAISWDAGASTGTLLKIIDDGATGQMWITVIGGVAPTDGDTILGAVSAATADVDGDVQQVGTPVEAEQIRHADAPTSARSVAFYDQRLVAGGIIRGGGGTDDYSMIQWSSQYAFDDWSSAGGGGWTTVGDSPDWIQTMQRLGENLIVYKERSIYIGRKTFLSDPPFRFSPAPGQGIGLAAPRSLGDLGEEHVFLGWDDVYVFSLKGLTPIGTRIREELFYGENGINPAYIHLTTGIIAEEFDEYWLFVPTGKWPDDDGGDRIPNLIENPIFLKGYDGEVPENWTETSAGGTSTVTLDVDGGGTMGPAAMDIFRDALSNAVTASQIYDYGVVIDDWQFSCVVFIATPTAGTIDYRVRLNSLDGAGANATEIVTHTSTITSAAGVTRIVLSGEVDDVDGEQVQIIIENLTDDSTLEVHGVHVVRIDNVDTAYHTGQSGTEEIGYISGDDTVQAPPLIVDQIGGYIFDTVWCWNYEENAWSRWRLPMTGFGYDVLQPVITIASLSGVISEQTWRYDEKRLVDLAPTNLIAQADGRIYEIADSYTYDWEETFDHEIVTYWESKDFDFDQPQMDKTFSRLVIFHSTDHSPVDVTVGVSTDSGVTYQDQVVTIRTGHTETFADFFVTGSQLRFRVSVETPGFFIRGFGVKIIPRGEINPY